MGVAATLPELSEWTLMWKIYVSMKHVWHNDDSIITQSINLFFFFETSL